jgi:large subunit ribosomal protein L25
MTTILNAQKRDGRGKGFSRKLRRDGRVPAVMYGKDMEAVSLSVDAMEAGHLFASISVENTILDITIEGEDEAQQALVRDIQAHPHKKEIIHIDFLRIQKGVAVDVEVPVELVGTPVGVKNEGGNLEHLVHEIPVRCIPSLIPQVIEVDVSGLHLDQALHVSDLKLPEGVEITIEDDRPICIVSAPRGGADDEQEGGEGVGEPEVIGHEED